MNENIKNELVRELVQKGAPSLTLGGVVQFISKDEITGVRDIYILSPIVYLYKNDKTGNLSGYYLKKFLIEYSGFQSVHVGDYVIVPNTSVAIDIATITPSNDETAIPHLQSDILLISHSDRYKLLLTDYNNGGQIIKNLPKGKYYLS